MNSAEKKLLEAAKVVLKLEALAPAPDVPLTRIPGWESLRLLQILMKLERELGVRFQAKHVARAKTWGDLVRVVETAIAAEP